ncbi:MAG: Rne/Rng family ribonuclease, partial [Rickettsiales bacterium]
RLTSNDSTEMNVSPSKENILKKIRKALSNSTPIPFPGSEGNTSLYQPSKQELEVEFAKNRNDYPGKELDYETVSKKQIKGYIYLAKVTRVEPGLQAAFVEYSSGKHGFLPFSEIHPSYFHINQKDQEDLNSQSNLNLSIPELQRPVISEEDDKDDIINDFIEINITKESDIALDKEVNDLDQSIENIEQNNMRENSADIEIENSQTYSNIYKDYKIHEVIKRNQIILVQAIKEERGNKGASFTSYVSLAGRYCVLMPNSERQGGISRRITDSADRKRIKNIVDKLDMPNGSIIVRTAGAKKKTSAIKKDYDYLVRLWNSIRDITISSSAPAFIHAEGDIIKRTIRDLYDDTVDEILVQGEKSYKQACDFMKTIIPDDINKIKHYKSKTPIFCRHQIEEQLSSLYSSTSYLSSGGYIVINHTEALISIDVNSGKSTSERNVEETAFKTNLEATAEIARQLRLRDLSGLLIIDFIDMADIKNKKIIEKNLKDALSIDRAKIQIGSISEFGLLEMSRQRLRSSFIESNTVTCIQCNGKGIVRTSESNSVMILRTIESEICKGEFESINVYACNDAVIYILNNKRNDISAIEKKYNTKIMFHNDNLASIDGFSIERIKRTFASKAQNAKIHCEDNVVYDEPIKEKNKQKKNWKNTEQTENQQSINKKSNKPRLNKKKNIIDDSVQSKEEIEVINQIENTVTALVVHEENSENVAIVKDKIEKKKSRYKAKRNKPKKEEESILKEIWKKIQNNL